jgi:hypothetical protein
VETAIDEMVRFELSEQSPYSFQMKKIFDLREYLMEHLLKQYGLRNIA